MKTLLQALLNSAGYKITRLYPSYPSDFTESEIETIRRVRPFTMTSPERIVAAIRSTEYIVQNHVPGSIVECGVWRGGSMMAIALTLLRLNKGNVPLYLLDTFEGMSEPTAIDGTTAYKEWEVHQRPTHNKWCFASLAEVQNNLLSTSYDRALIYLIKGKVEDTLPDSAPAQISLLRLDTDWYESTKYELEHLFPRLSSGGVLLIDDYGYWEGARKAVDEYIEQNRLTIFLNRIDNTGRIGIKL
jgi:O-methyltransferase